MKVIEIDCWEVVESYDRNESVIARFASDTDSYQFIRTHKNKSYLRTRHLTKTYVICESLEDHANYVLESKKQAALAKLTDEEKKLLGLIQ